MASGTRRRNVWPLVALAGLVLAGLLVGLQPTGYQSTKYYGLQGHPTRAQQFATSTATVGYRTFVLRTTQNFSTEVLALQRDATSNNLEAAKLDWQRAQATYDQIRGLIAENSMTTLRVDGLVSDLPTFFGRFGLHAVEQDLYGNHLDTLAADVQSVVGMGTILEIGLMRTQRTPTAILTLANEQLAWAVRKVITTPQERYSRLDLLDVVAVTNAASRMLELCRPLSHLVDPRGFARARSRLDALQRTLGPLVANGPRTREQVNTATWRRLSNAIDATLEPLTTLAGHLYGYGTGRVYA